MTIFYYAVLMLSKKRDNILVESDFKVLKAVYISIFRVSNYMITLKLILSYRKNLMKLVSDRDETAKHS